MRRRSVSAAAAASVAAIVSLGAMTGASGARPARVLPDLVPQPPEEVMGPATTYSMGLGVDAPFIVDGCYPEERVRKGAKRCLRFDTIVGNAGQGPLELAYAIEKSKVVAAIQRIFRSDGSYGDRVAVRSEFHPTHAHFHVEDFYVSRLWQAGPRGERAGDAPVASGDKNGFCPEDSRPIDDDADRKGGTYTCFTRDEPRQRGFQVVGISAGWEDVYSANLPDQFVEITGVPDGRYVLEIELDPHNVFVESDDSNNTICVLLDLKGPQAEIVEPRVVC